MLEELAGGVAAEREHALFSLVAEDIGSFRGGILEVARDLVLPRFVECCSFFGMVQLLALRGGWCSQCFPR